MAISNYKITDGEVNTNQVESAPDTLSDTPTNNKKVFDNLVKVLITKYNNLVDNIDSDFIDISKVGDGLTYDTDLSWRYATSKGTTLGVNFSGNITSSASGYSTVIASVPGLTNDDFMDCFVEINGNQYQCKDSVVTATGYMTTFEVNGETITVTYANSNITFEHTNNPLSTTYWNVQMFRAVAESVPTKSLPPNLTIKGVIANTLPPSSPATAVLSDGIVTLGIPKGDKGDTGTTPDFSVGTVTTGAEGSSAAATITGTDEAPVLNLTIPRGNTGKGIQSIYKVGESGTVKTYTILYTDGTTFNYDVTDGADGSLASGVLASTYSSSATYEVGDYVYYSGDLFRCTTAITTAEAWTSGHWTQVAIADEVADLKSDLDKTRNYTGYVEDYISLCTTEGAIQASDGAPYANSIQITDNYKYSPFIPIKSGEKISYKLRTPSTYCMIAFYTTAQTSGYVSASSLVGTGGGTSGTFTAPSDGFVRITSRNDLTDKYAIYSVNGQIQRIDGLVATNAQNIDTLQKGLINAVEVGYVADEYVNQFNGSFTAYTGWNRTKYINVPPTATMDVNGVTRTSIYNYFYKADFTPLSRFDLALGDNIVTVPSQAKYFVLSTTASDLANIEIRNPALYNYGDSTANITSYFKIASWNVGLFNNGITAPSTAESPQKMIDFRKIIGNIDADVINTDEYRQYFDAENTILATPNVMSFKYPYNTQGTQVSGNVSFSKAEISNATKKVFDSGSGKYFIWYETNVNGKKVTVINAHLAIEEDPTVHRNSEIQELITFMSGKEYVVLTGDFNVASKAEYDAFKTAGYTLCNGGDFGWFNTWPIRANLPDGWQTTWPCENLDNIIVSSNIVPQCVKAIDCNISDHAPLYAELKIN